MSSPACSNKFNVVIINSDGYDSRPRSVAVGDFNNDHGPDIAVANYLSGNIGVFLHFSNGTFLSQMIYSTGSDSFPHSLAIGDFNNDNQLDIVVANYGTNNIGVFLGYGNGSFANQTTHSTGTSRPLSVAIGDFNNDNRLDIVIANYDTNNVGLLLGYGSGKFESQITYSTGYDSLPYCVVVGDFNNDNWLDIAVANSGINSVSVLLGYGNGSFASQTTYSTGLGALSYSVTIGDFNNDTRIDIAVANSGANSVGVLLGFGNGTFASQTTYETGLNSSSYSVAVGDFNKDTRLDIAVTNYGTRNIGILLGYGDGTFANQTTYSTDSSHPLSITVGDFNNDNRLDIAVVNNDSNNLGILFGSDLGLFASPTKQDTPPSPLLVTIGDFNNDTKLDITVIFSDANNFGVFLGYGNGTFDQQIINFTDSSTSAQTSVVGDFNNDHRLDIVVPSSNGDIMVFLGCGNGTFDSRTTHSSDLDDPHSIAAGDFNSDHQLDIVVTNSIDNTVFVFLGNGNGTFFLVSQIRSPVTQYFGEFPVTVGDFNNDHHLDIAFADSLNDSIGILLGYGNGSFANQTINPLPSQSKPNSIAVGDFNNDNWLDIVVSNDGTNSVGLLLGFGNGTFAPQRTLTSASGSSPLSVAVGDFNKDTLLDIAVANSQNGFQANVGIFIGYGNGTFQSEKIYLTGSGTNPCSIAVGDFNNDNRLDIVVADSGQWEVEVLLGYDNGALASQMTYSTGSASLPYFVAIGDCNNDTRADIAVANSGTNNIEIILGHGDGTFGNQTTYSTGSDSLPYSVVFGDFNRDTLLDMAVANSGANSVGVLLGCGNGTFASQITYSSGDGSRPQSVAIGDFNSDNWLDITVANDGTDNIAVLLGYDYAVFANEMTYSTNTQYRPLSVALGDFNNDHQLDIAVANSWTSFVGIFLGHTDGTFGAQKTYATDNSLGISGPNSVAIGDFNNDSQLDIAVPNSNNGNIGVLFGFSNGTFSDPINLPTGYDSYPQYVAVGDFNNDNKLDMAVANSHSDNIGIFLGHGDGTFENQILNLLDLGSFPRSLAVGDFNHDDQLDIVVPLYSENQVVVLLGNGDGTFTNQLNNPTGSYSSPYPVVVADFNNDTRLDIIVGNSDSDTVVLLLGYGNGTFEAEKTYSIGSDSRPESIAVGDFNNDKRLDIVVADSSRKNVMILLGYVNDVFANQTTYSIGLSSDPCSVAIGDFNHDNRLDIVVANYETDELSVFLGHRNEPFSNLEIFSTGNSSRPQSVVIGDFNADNRLDIAVANYATDNIGVLLGLGNGSFTSQVTYSTGNGSNPCFVTIGDFNNDSRLDIAVAKSGSGNVDVLFGYGNGTFTIETIYPTQAESIPLSIAVGDFNSDTRLDIAVANSGSHSIAVFYGYGNGTFTLGTTYSMGYGSHPYSLVGDDFNNDRRIDIAVANYGGNNVEILLNMC